MTPTHPTQASVGEVKYPELPNAVTNQLMGDDWEDLFTADQMRSYADATCALRGAQKESGWRPIETAPRVHGQRVLLLRDAGGGAFPAIGYALDGVNGWCSNECRGLHTLENLGYRVTHWQPLPSAPTPEGEAK